MHGTGIGIFGTGLFPGGTVWRAVALTTLPHPAPRLKKE